jgi:hypothetical protein
MVLDHAVLWGKGLPTREPKGMNKIVCDGVVSVNRKTMVGKHQCRKDLQLLTMTTGQG